MNVSFSTSSLSVSNSRTRLISFRETEHGDQKVCDYAALKHKVPCTGCIMTSNTYVVTSIVVRAPRSHNCCMCCDFSDYKIKVVSLCRQLSLRQTLSLMTMFFYFSTVDCFATQQTLVILFTRLLIV